MTARTGESRPAGAQSRASDRRAVGIIVGAVCLGALLRIVMAQGDLWLDEVWSLELVRPLGSSLDVFTGVSHDNNHILNSLWLFWLGPDRAPWLYRIPAVALGAASVILAAAVVWPRSRAGAAAAAVLTSTAMPLVVYGSEARGYAGLVAAILLAIAAFERALDPTGDVRGRQTARWLLGAAVCFGTLFHLTMLFTVAVLGSAALVHFAERDGLSKGVNATLAFFRPALLGLIPAAAAFVGGVVRTGGFTTGNTSPASLATLLRGYGDQTCFTLGFPAATPVSLSVAVAGILIIAAVRSGRLSPTAPAVLLAAVLILPGTMLALHLPNLEFARYYMVSGLALLLAAACLVGTLWDTGGMGLRCAAVALTTCLVGGHLAADAAAVRDGRGRYGEALAGMADAHGHLRYATPAPFWVGTVAATAAHRRGLTTVSVADSAFCSTPPNWLIDVPETDADRVRGTVEAGPAACRATFTLDRTIAVNPLSGMPWMIYRRSRGDDAARRE